MASGIGSKNDPGKGANWNATSYRMDLGHDDPNYGTPEAGIR